MAAGKTHSVRRRAGHHARYRSRNLPVRHFIERQPPAAPAPEPAFRPRVSHGVIGVSKAYITRVGSGPFPTESTDAGGDLLRREGNEFGAVTGRPRRCGWFDAPLLRYTATINGFDTLVITKLDVLDILEEIPVCTGYRLAGAEIDEMPATYRALEAIDPVYTMLPGWCTSTRGIARYEDLPELARSYLKFLEDHTGVEVGGISTGPERNETIIRPGSKLERLI